MKTTLISELKNKQVINQKNGCFLGYISDVEIDCQSGCILSLIIFGKGKLFGLGKRDCDTKILWKDISVIGDKTILVCSCSKYENTKDTKNGLSDLFS